MLGGRPREIRGAIDYKGAVTAMKRLVKPLGIGLVIAGFVVRSQGC